jgi:hypothetical protein
LGQTHGLPDFPRYYPLASAREGSTVISRICLSSCPLKGPSFTLFHGFPWRRLYHHPTRPGLEFGV